MVDDPRRALKVIESRKAQIASVRGQTYTIYGHVDIIGNGEKLLPVNFPVWFTERPIISGSGYATGGLDSLVETMYPTWNVGTAAYRMHPNNDLLYIGATLILVVTGSLDESILTWRAEGNALSNPVPTA